LLPKSRRGALKRVVLQSSGGRLELLHLLSAGFYRIRLPVLVFISKKFGLFGG
jgi:hypothetical protein